MIDWGSLFTSKKKKSTIYKPQPGIIYLVPESSENGEILGISIFREFIFCNVPGLLISSVNPKEIVDKAYLGFVRTLWLSEEQGANNISTKNVPAIVSVIEKFTSQAHSIILFHNLNHLFKIIDFNKIIEFFKEVSKIIVNRNSCILVSMKIDDIPQYKLNALTNIMVDIKTVAEDRGSTIEPTEVAGCYRCGAVFPISEKSCPECGAEFE